MNTTMYVRALCALLANTCYCQTVFNPPDHPWYDELGIVKKTKIIKLNDQIKKIYNASILEWGPDYLLIFRWDEALTKHIDRTYQLTYKPHIKMVVLDEKFKQKSPIRTLLDTTTPQDARIHTWRGDVWLTFNDESPDLYGARRLFFGKLNFNKMRLEDIKQVPSGNHKLIPVEKNWTPFEYPEGNGSLYYIYSTSPYHVIKIDGIAHEKVSLLEPPTPNIYKIWDKERWGEIRGGTPARRIDDVYLTFFHSTVTLDNNRYYFIGAYIFDAKPPFTIRAITPEPIWFKKIFSTQRGKSSLIFPCGFAFGKKKDKTLLHLSCGESDTHIRIISIDKDKFFEKMVRV